VEPAAAEIDRITTRFRRERPPAEPCAGFNQQIIDTCIVQPPGGGNARRTAASHDNLNFPVGQSANPDET
jgi:hypothetical protein